MKGRCFKTHEKFMTQIKEKYGDRYDYTNVHYIGDRDPVELICKLHGSFLKSPNHLLRGQGCQKCALTERGKNHRISQDRFIEKAKEIHGGLYDYSKVEYITGHLKVAIICKIHGEFLQSPSSHCKGRGCPECYELTRGASQKFTQEDFIKRAIEKHGDLYDYSKVEYINSQQKVKIICKIHGEFEQVATSHLKYGCQLCANEKITKSLRLTNDEFIKACIEIHGSKYDYSKVEYITGQTKVIIGCKKHGDFKQTATSHLYGNRGCPRCKTSLGEIFIREWLERNKIEFEEQKMFDTCKHKRKLKFDFYIKSKNLLIEFDGVQHFPEEIAWKYKTTFQISKDEIAIRDKIKTDWALENGIPLHRIKYSDDWNKRLGEIFSEKCDTMQT